MVVTEKIDGTNACIQVLESGELVAQSRNRIITPDDDNYGFAAWVAEHETELREELGRGVHFGEWWGLGIQRGYGQDRKRFSLFNTHRWWGNFDRPRCCDVAPILRVAKFDLDLVAETMDDLGKYGSILNPDFHAEGVMIYVPELGQYIKNPFEAGHKGQR